MIEKIIMDHLAKKLDVPVFGEVPENPPASYVVVVRSGGGGREDFLHNPMVLCRSYAATLAEAAKLNDRAVEAMDSLTECDEVSGCYLTGSYNFTDQETKQYRYQAVYNIYHY